METMINENGEPLRLVPTFTQEAVFDPSLLSDRPFHFFKDGLLSLRTLTPEEVSKLYSEKVILIESKRDDDCPEIYFQEHVATKIKLLECLYDAEEDLLYVPTLC